MSGRMSGRCASCAMRAACRLRLLRLAITAGKPARDCQSRDAERYPAGSGAAPGPIWGAAHPRRTACRGPDPQPPADRAGDAPAWHSGSRATPLPGATGCARQTASIPCRSRPTCWIGISWPTGPIRACPGAGRGLVGRYPLHPDWRGLALFGCDPRLGCDPRPVHPEGGWLGDARSYACRTHHGRPDHGNPTTPPRAGPDPSRGPRQPVCRRRLLQDPAGYRHHPIPSSNQ
jgi:hypothetical protein